MKIKRAKRPLHGRASFIAHNKEGIFKNLPNPLTVGCYHSLIVAEHDISEIDSLKCNVASELIITARSLEGEIMALQHKKFPIFGVQFHPESVLTNYGIDMLKNFTHNINRKGYNSSLA